MSTTDPRFNESPAVLRMAPEIGPEPKEVERSGGLLGEELRPPNPQHAPQVRIREDRRKGFIERPAPERHHATSDTDSDDGKS